MTQGARTARGVAEQHDAHASLREGGDCLDGASVRLLSIVQTPVLIEQHALQREPIVGVHCFRHSGKWSCSVLLPAVLQGK